MILGANMVAVEGAHGTGKTTFVHALVAALMQRHRQVASIADLARRSPFVEEVVIHGQGGFGVSAQLHLLAAQLAEEQLLARHNEIVICDKSVMGAVAYARVFADGDQTPADAALLDAMAQLARTYSSRYDAVILMSTLYDLDRTDDPYRLRDGSLRERTQRVLEEELAQSAAPLLRMPANLDASAQVTWAIGQLDGIA
jgi:thymidylate kinase